MRLLGTVWYSGLRSWLYPLPWKEAEVQAEELLFPNWILGGKSLIYQNGRQEARQLGNWDPERPKPCKATQPCL